MELSGKVHAPEVVIEHRQEEDVGLSESIGEEDVDTKVVREKIPQNWQLWHFLIEFWHGLEHLQRC